MSTCFYVSTLTITSSKPENVCLSHTRKEAQRGWMPDLRPHSKLTGHWDLNLGLESGLQSPSIQQRPKHSHPPLCGMWRTSSRNAVTRTVWEFELSPPQPRCLVSPLSTWQARAFSTLPSSVPLDLLLPISVPAAGWFEDTGGRRYKKSLRSLHPTACAEGGRREEYAEVGGVGGLPTGGH